jgi:hypothetical protein
MSIVKLNNRAVKDATAVGSITGLGNLKFISRSTASSSASLSITSGINSTYKEYIFYFNNIHPSAEPNIFSFQASTDGGSSYGITTTSSFFEAYNRENNSDAFLRYEDGNDQAQGTSYQKLNAFIGSADDECCSGYLHLFDPSNTTFLKHYISNISTVNYNDPNYAVNSFVSGYFNTTSAIDAIDFKLVSSGNIDSGTIDMYGVL